MCVCVCVCVCVYLGSISSLMQISLNIIDILCLHIFFRIRSNSRITFIVFSDNNNIYVGLTSTTLSRRLTMHISDTSSIAQHLKKHSCPTTQLRKILTDNTTILTHQNNKQKLHTLEALYIRNLQPALNRINFQTSANVLKCL